MVGVIAWAVALAVYQPVMEPNGSWLGPDGMTYPELASNATAVPPLTASAADTGRVATV